MSDIQNSIKNKTNEQLLDDIGLGSDAYRDDVFELYLKEAKERGLDISEEKIKKIHEKKKIRSIEQEAKIQLAIGIVLLLFAFGLFAFIPGLNLLKKDKQRNYIYKSKYKGFAKFITIWSILMWILILFGIIISLLG